MRDDYTGWMEVELRAVPSIGRKMKSADLPLPYRICPALRSRHRETGFRPARMEATRRRRMENSVPGERKGYEKKDTRGAMRTKLKKEEGRGGRGKRERGVDSFPLWSTRMGRERGGRIDL